MVQALKVMRTGNTFELSDVSLEFTSFGKEV